MRRMRAVLIVLLFCFSLASCGKAAAPSGTEPSAPEETETPSNTEPLESPGETESSKPGGIIVSEEREDFDIDVDMTALSSTMVYSYVFDMMVNPQTYEGMNFLVEGVYSDFYLELTEETYHYVVISDATACCAQGLEFILDKGAGEYPAPDAEIEVKGTFKSYVELEETYYYLQVWSLEVTG